MPQNTESRILHLVEHVRAQPGDCATTSELRRMLNDALLLNGEARNTLTAIEEIEVVCGEFVSASELYRALGKPIPAPIDHAANLRAKTAHA